MFHHLFLVYLPLYPKINDPAVTGITTDPIPTDGMLTRARERRILLINTKLNLSMKIASNGNNNTR